MKKRVQEFFDADQLEMHLRDSNHDDILINLLTGVEAFNINLGLGMVYRGYMVQDVFMLLDQLDVLHLIKGIEGDVFKIVSKDYTRQACPMLDDFEQELGN